MITIKSNPMPPDAPAILDCGHRPSDRWQYNGRPAWQYVIDWDGQRRICHACADARVLDCGHSPSIHEPWTTGYGTTPDGRRHCYACIGAMDRAAMLADGRATLYLAERKQGDGSGRWFVTYWPGSLEFPCSRVSHSRHGGGFGSPRSDAWFIGPDGATWHAVNRGDSQIARCRRLKGARA